APKSPPSTLPAASIRSPTGAAVRRTNRATRASPMRSSRPTPMAVAEPALAPSSVPTAQASSNSALTAISSTRPKKQPTRRMNRPRIRRQPAGPDGGQASPSGHHGGRSPLPQRRPQRWSGIGQAVADAIDGQQALGSVRVGLDLAPQVLDMGVDRPLVR